jgi:hypothetical protein
MPLKLGFKIKVPTVKGSATRSLEQVSEVVLRQAARSWLRAMVKAVPVWEGTARGTLKPLGRFLRVAVPISPVADPRKRRATIGGKLFNLGPVAGEAYSEYELIEEFPKYILKFTEKLPYVVWNSFGQPLPQVKSAPWFAFDKAGEAAKATVREELRKRIGQAWIQVLGTKTING